MIGVENKKEAVLGKEYIKGQGLLIILIGPTAGGKDSVMERLLKENPLMKRVVT